MRSLIFDLMAAYIDKNIIIYPKVHMYFISKVSRKSDKNQLDIKFCPTLLKSNIKFHELVGFLINSPGCIFQDCMRE